MKKTTGPGKGKPMMKDMKPAMKIERKFVPKKLAYEGAAQAGGMGVAEKMGSKAFDKAAKKTENIKPMGIAKATKMEGPKSVKIAKTMSAPKPGRSVVKTKGIYSRTVDGKDQMVKEKTKTVTKGGLTKKTVVKGKGMAGSVIGKYKEVKRFK
jgi:hypothetical protein